MNFASSIVIAMAFGAQVIWTFLIRRGQIHYTRDLYHFRAPSTIFSRYYHWRVSSQGVTMAEALLVNGVSLGAIIYFGMLVLGFYAFHEISWLILVMVGFSIITVVQIFQRSRRMHLIEHTIIQKMKDSVDKIAEAKSIVNQYISAGKFTKVSVWLALFRVAQIQNSVGWAMRDVLLEKRDAVDTRNKTEAGISETSNGPSGPSIE
ncbi:MAG: hypothetical protein ACTSYL_07035 [Candidatus Thorarchaeota archaeon]